jgi:hypothetical protein
MKTRKEADMSTKQWNVVGICVIIIAMLIVMVVTAGCSGGKAVVTEYDNLGNRTKQMVVDPYVLARDVINNGGELWLEVSEDGSILYWLVLGDHASKVSPENARMIKEAIKAVNPVGGILE